jgi:serine phosphatase RsbU (regulator of sigma subunit)
MSDNEALFREKATLLLKREREALDLRVRHDRAAAWLEVALSLSDLVAGDQPLGELLTRVSRNLVAGLKLQKVIFFEQLPGSVRSMGTGRVVSHDIDTEFSAFIATNPSGVCNAETEPPALRQLSAVSGLSRFMWYDFELGQTHLLMFAGFTREKSAFYPPFTADDVSHFKNAGRHLCVLIKNLLLVRELEQDKARLAQFADTLELRVVARTQDLAKANAELSTMLAALREKDEHIRADLEQACSFQQSILPVLPRSPLIEFGSLFRPLNVVGGDIFDVEELDPGRFRVFVADATGHGVQASMRTVVLKLEYDRLKRDHSSPATLLTEFNDRLIRMYPSGDMVSTACCFDIDLRTHSPRLVYANAAHPSVLRVSRKRIEEIHADSPLLGMMTWSSVVTREIELAPGDLIVAYTDGICEQRVPSGALFDLERELLQVATPEASPQLINSTIFARFEEFRGVTPVADDIAMITARLAARG